MNITQLLKTEICYFSFELNTLPPDEVNELIGEKTKFGYARMLNPVYYLGYTSSEYLCGIYDFFSSEQKNNIEDIKGYPFLFNQKLTFPPDLRGRYKWRLVGSELQSRLNLPDELPHMITSHLHKDDEIVSYYKNGVYAVSVGLGQAVNETQFKNLKHLGEKSIESTRYLIQYIYAELLKRKNNNYSPEELFNKLEKFLRNVDEWENLTERDKKNVFSDFIKLMHRPVYRSIPEKYREKAINEVDKQ